MMDPFATDSTTNGIASGAGLPELAVDDGIGGGLVQPPPEPRRSPVAGDPHETRIAEAVAYMAGEYWGQGKMQGALLEQWHKQYASLLTGCVNAQQVSQAARLADYAMAIALFRQNQKARGKGG